MEDGFIVTREDVIINYIPSSDVISYYYVINDSNPIYVNSLDNTEIVLNNDGKYNIDFINTNIDNSTNVVNYKYIIDRENPKLNIKSKTYVMNTRDKFNLDVSAFDNYDGDLTNKIKTNIDTIDFKSSGVKKINLSVSDSAGNVNSDIIYVTVRSENTSVLYLGWLVLAIFVIMLVNFLYKFIRSIKFEKRFSKFTINNSSKSLSLFDGISNNYEKFVIKYSKYLEKSKLILKSSKKYEKYGVNGIKFYFNKIVLGIIYVLLFLILNLFRLKVVNIIELLIPFLLGFITLDIIYYIKYKSEKKQIRNDLLTAITLLNNAFKSGRSINQAIKTVGDELDGRIAQEFKQISEELSLGLDLDVAFKRFRDRIKLEEAAYLSASISVVSVTGGNIIKVFDSIEKTLYSKKKLNEELNSLTSSSRFIMYVLIIVPVAFIFFIALLNKDYFKPLITNPIGIIIILVEIVIYILYIIVVRKTMKIRWYYEIWNY